MASSANGILVEAEAFEDYGGWSLDSQFELEMGSPYLIAHGHGVPVADATTHIQIQEAGDYYIWVRAKDWVPGHHPGRFTLSINNTVLDTVFGANDKDWIWQPAGQVKLESGEKSLTLHDLTGFDGRCDAIFLSLDKTAPPDTMDASTHAWRRKLRNLPDSPITAGSFDVVVVGGGIPGVAATLTAARLGQRVALIQNRGVLGGNASVEAGLRPRGITGGLVDAIARRHPNGDLHAMQLLQKEPNVTVFLEHTVYDAVVKDSRIISVDAREARTGQERRFAAPVFIDCSGRVILGMLSGAETLYGQESKAEFGESLAPARGDQTHHGNTIFFRTRMAESPTPFPEVPWAVEVAKDYANLGGQLEKPGVDNAPGPIATSSSDPVPDPTLRRRMNITATHFWEVGQHMDPYTQGEHIRDHLLRAIYGTFSNVKTFEPEKYANLALDWVAYVPATGEFRRYKGPHVLTETEIREHTKFPDAVVQNGGAFCLHYPGHKKYDFRLRDWKWDERDGEPYDIPFRCLYSSNVENLMMAGKHISVTHVAGSNTKFMGNGAQHAIATAAAACLCNRHGTTPEGLYKDHLEELQSLVRSVLDAQTDAYKSRL